MQDPDYIRIPLRRRDGSVRAYALIDVGDAHLAEHRWCLSSDGYAVRKTDESIVRLHRAILGLHQGDGLQGDHINRDRLDNRRSNLRVVTNAENHQNVPGQDGKTSEFRGVSWNARKHKWQACVRAKGHLHWLGFFVDESRAAEAAAEFRVRNLPFSVD